MNTLAKKRLGVARLLNTTALTCAFIGASAHLVHAAEWEVTPSVTLQEVLTDNSGLSPDDEETDLISQVSADLSIVGGSPKLRAYLDGGVSYDKYIERDDQDGFRARLLAGADAMLIDEIFSVEGRVSITEQNLFQDLLPGSGDRSLDNDRTRIYTYSISPHLRDRFGDSTEGGIRLEASGSFFDDTDTGSAALAPEDDNTWRAEAYLGSVEEKPGFGWRVVGYTLESDRDFKRTTVDGRIEFPLGNKFRPYVHGGHDEIDSASVDEDERSGEFWGVGSIITLGPRLTMDLEGGERYGDATARANIEYRINDNSTLTVTYDEDVLTRQQGLERSLRVLQFSPNDQLFTDIGTLPDLIDTILDLQDEVYKEERLRIGLGGQFNRTNIQLDAFHIQREFDATLTEETNVGGSLTLNRELTQNLTLEASAIYSETTEGQFPDDENRRYSLSIGGRYNFSQDLFVTGRYQFQKSERDTRGDITENALIAAITRVF